MAEPTIRAGRVDIADDCEFGDDVVIDADEVVIGPGSRIGMSDGDDFRTPPGVRIALGRLTVGPRATIGRAVRIEGGDVRLDAGVRILRHATIRVAERLVIGAHGTVGEQCEISGRDVIFGQELWMLPGAKIGGGSAFEPESRLEAGHYLHLGVDTLVNTARPVTIGHEVGLGTRTSIYTHGAYPSALNGFPVAFAGVQIGDFTWVPGAIINPGVRIGRNCVIGVNSLVTKSVPDGCLAAGSPATVIREGAFPRPLTGEALLRFWQGFLAQYAVLLQSDAAVEHHAGDGAVVLTASDATYAAVVDPVVWERHGRSSLASGDRLLVVGPTGTRTAAGPASTVFDTATSRVDGLADPRSDKLANELRRHGIRFYSRPQDGRYQDWAEPPARATPAATEAPAPA